MRPKADTKRAKELVDELDVLNNDLAEIVQEISNICSELGDNNAKHYLVAQLQIIVESGDWLSNDLTLPKWIERIQTRIEEGYYD
jgi:uncharacterized coiled-coil DUF342 family protein